MKVIEFSLSDFNSLQRALLQNFSFSEISFQLFKSLDDTHEVFFRRIFLESGLEIWALSGQFGCGITLKQKKTSATFGAVHVFDLANNKGLMVVNGNTTLEIDLRANESFTFIAYVYSQRWLDSNLLNSPYFNDIFKKEYPFRKYFFDNVESIKKILSVVQRDIYGHFTLRIKVLAYFDYLLGDITEQSNKVKTGNLTCSSTEELLIRIENILIDTLNLKLEWLFATIEENGYNLEEITTLFEKKNGMSCWDYHLKRKMELAARLLKDGINIREVTKRIGYESSSTFGIHFKKIHGVLPKEY